MILTESMEYAEFEVWQDEMMVAGTSGPRAMALADAQHYYLIYSQDGPVKLYEVTRVEVVL